MITDQAPPISPAVAPRSRGRALLLRAVFALWVVACLVGGGYMLSSHLLTLPTPELTDLGPQRSAVATRRSTEQGKWLAVHILDQECKCSQRVLDRVLGVERFIETRFTPAVRGREPPQIAGFMSDERGGLLTVLDTSTILQSLDNLRFWETHR